MEVKILSARFDIKDAHKIKVAKKHGAYATLDKLFAMKPEEVIEVVKNKRSARQRRGWFSSRCKMGLSAQKYR